MLYSTALTAAAASLLLAPVYADGLYTKNSPVIQVDKKNYDRLIANSNHTSIVEFYAPWCGHCQNLKPAYEKAAKSLVGLAKVAAVNCDEETNKPLCGQMGVQGFPTLKIIRPGKKPGRPIVEDYNGGRSAKAIVDTVVDKIPNHVKRIGDKEVEGWLKEGNETAKAILFTEKGTTSALLRALAVDFLGSVSVAQIRNKDKKAVEIFGVDKFPALIVLPGGEKEALVYQGEMKKEPMVAFVAQVASPNPDPAPEKPKAKKASKSDKKESKASSSFAKASASHESADSASMKATATSLKLEDVNTPTESPDPNVVTEDTQKPIKLEEVPAALPSLDSEATLNAACLGPKSHTCILAFLPADASTGSALTASASLSDISAKHHRRNSNIFPFYTVPSTNPKASTLRSALNLASDSGVQIIATNAKRSWYKPFSGKDYSKAALENWIDAIRMGEGKKEKLPEGVVVSEEEAAKGGAGQVKIDMKDSTITFEDLKAGSIPDGLKIELEEVVDDEHANVIRDEL